MRSSTAPASIWLSAARVPKALLTPIRSTPWLMVTSFCPLASVLAVCKVSVPAPVLVMPKPDMDGVKPTLTPAVSMGIRRKVVLRGAAISRSAAASRRPELATEPDCRPMLRKVVTAPNRASLSRTSVAALLRSPTTEMPPVKELEPARVKVPRPPRVSTPVPVMSPAMRSDWPAAMPTLPPPVVAPPESCSARVKLV